MIKNKTLSSLVLLSLFSIALVSCNSEDTNELDGKGPNILRADAGPDKLAVAPTVTSSVTIAQVWKDANSAAAFSQSVSASFSTDAQIVTDYNTANGTSYLPLPADKFSFNPATLDFGPTDMTKTLGITMNAAGLDLSKDYALGLVMDATGYIAGGDKFIKIALPSAYEGDYVSTGERYNFNAVSDANASTWPPTGYASVATWNYDPSTANTLSSKTVAVHAANQNGGFGRINITVNPADNSVTIVPNSDIQLNALVQSARPSTYDPATKTFELYYEYTNANGTYRMLHDKLVHK